MKLTDLEIGQFATTKEWEVKNFYIRRKSRLDFSCYRNSIFERNIPSIPEDGSLWHSYFYKDDFKLCDHNGKIIKEFTYPLYMENITHESVADRIVKFVSLTEGTVVIQGNSVTLPGHRSTDWIEHSNNKHWKPYDFFKAPEIDDLDYWDARFKAGLPVYYSKDNYYHIRHKFKILPSKLMELNKTKFDMLYIEQIEEFTYPMYFESIENNEARSFIVKFTEISEGEIVKVSSQSTCKVGYVSSKWRKHTETENWKQVNFDEIFGKIIPTQDDIDELISNLKSIIEDNNNRFNYSEYGSGTQLRDSGCDQCHDLIDEWMEKYYINKAPDISKEYFRYFGDLVDMIMHIESTLLEQKSSEPYISFIPNEKAKSRLHNDALDVLPYAKHIWDLCTGATENVANNLNQTKEFTMNNELKEAILELIATNGNPKVKKPKTAKIVCNVEGTLMEFADEAALKSFMWSSRVESVIRYDLSGKVTVPFELSVEAPKTKASK